MRKRYCIRMRFDEKLKAWRTARGHSQAHAAGLIGTTQRAWAAWEAFEAAPSVAMALKLIALEGMVEVGLTIQDMAYDRMTRGRPRRDKPKTKLKASTKRKAA
jgi:transcriptional regulator with XRE-family HTH domain